MIFTQKMRHYTDQELIPRWDLLDCPQVAVGKFRTWETWLTFRDDWNEVTEALKTPKKKRT